MKLLRFGLTQINLVLESVVYSPSFHRLVFTFLLFKLDLKQFESDALVY